MLLLSHKKHQALCVFGIGTNYKHQVYSGKRSIIINHDLIEILNLSIIPKLNRWQTASMEKMQLASLIIIFKAKKSRLLV